ncbi:MAG: response regulator transcription factor [Saprospiraceae bacterium]|nr:response regulator transcription factor [Saprospiraceae bacterium]
MMRVLMIEDELPAARQLGKLLQTARPQYQLIDALDSVESAVRWLQTFSTPDLILMDIQIADGLSFDIFRQVEIKCPVIFTTAFDHYAVQAFRVNAVDYLLKPVDPDELEKALEKFENQRISPSINLEVLSRLFQPEQYKERFLVKNGQHFTFIQTTDIAFFRSSDGLTQAYCFNGKKHFIDHTLDELDRLLNPKDFFRISRNMTLHLHAIKKVHPHLNGRLKLDLAPASLEEVLVSRERSSAFKQWLGG